MRRSNLRLQDIAEAIRGIEDTIAGSDLAAFGESWPMQRAVERGLEIISEASRGLDLGSKSAFPDVPWAQIAAIGNILRHEYHRVEPLVIWNIMLKHLPRLKLAVAALLKDDPAG